MGDNEQKALQLMAEAEKKLTQQKGFLGSLFGFVQTKFRNGEWGNCSMSMVRLSISTSSVPSDTILYSDKGFLQQFPFHYTHYTIYLLTIIRIRIDVFYASTQKLNNAKVRIELIISLRHVLQCRCNAMY